LAGLDSDEPFFRTEQALPHAFPVPGHSKGRYAGAIIATFKPKLHTSDSPEQNKMAACFSSGQHSVYYIQPYTPFPFLVHSTIENH
jgi:hypothetical protein